MVSGLFDADELADMRLLINIETLDGCEKITQILSADNIDLLDGIVLGRTDLSAAMKVTDPDSPLLLDKAKEVFRITKQKSIRCLIGGGISVQTGPFIRSLAGLLDGFETRKLVFSNFDIDYCRRDRAELEQAIFLALEFEYCWYLRRQEMYRPLLNEDAGRIKKLAGVLGR